MKKLIYAALVLMTATVLIAFYVTRQKTVPVPSVEPDISAGSSQLVPESKPIERAQSTPPVPPQPTVASIAPTQPVSTTVNPIQQAVDTLVSPHATFDQKQTAWHQFSDTNLLNEAIADLENRVKANPTAPEPHAALGMAYLHKCGMIQDVREMGILAMNADKSFDTALDLDASNWDARFTKAVAMSFWPDQLNKSSEVLEHFRLLVEQQEAQSPQPHFAMTYLKLGEQYQKAGYSDYAQQVYERGAALFPENKDLQAKVEPE